MAKNSVADKVIIAIVAAVVPLVVSGVVIYFASIPSDAQVKDNTEKIVKVVKKVEKLEEKINKNIAAQNTKIQEVDSKVNRVLSGLCIIEPKTCSLKKKPD